MRIYIVFLCISIVVIPTSCYKFEDTLGQLLRNGRKDSDIQAKAVKDLIRRTLPGHAEYFDVEIDFSKITDGKDSFMLRSENGTIKIMATSGVAAASAFNYYLKYYCNCHISWETQQLKLPQPLPEVNVEIKFNDWLRYYQNVCTTSYSFVWWDWKQWEKHIDWIVMNSFNLVLASNGQEAIWSEVYQEFGLTQDDIDDFFTGPAFLSWLRMGNVRKWGGSLSLGWHRRSLVLQKAILKRLRSFGVITVLPGFAGHLPRAFKRLYPKANMVKLGTWNDFNDTYCCPYFLDPTEELFQTIGKMFIEKQIAEFGSDNIYNCDSFNENTPPTTNLEYLSNVSRSIFKAMTAADPNAFWLMQNWLFVHDKLYWSKDRARALLTGIPKGRMIILDLQSEQFPQYEFLDQYFGQPYIWCMLHNFGGTLGMYGNSDIINERPVKARLIENSTMIGTGLTMEGINQNYIIYDLMTETAWRQTPTNLTKWFENYTIRRYGQRNEDAIESWTNLQKTVYNLKGLRRMRGQYAVTRTPSWSIQTWIWYNDTEFYKTVKKFQNAAVILKNNDGYKHDFVDLNRQVIQVFNDGCYEIMRKAYKKKNLKTFTIYSNLFLVMLEEMEKYLATNRAFLLSEWVKSARAAGSTPDEKDMFEYNARNQITLWGPNGEIMNYAIKQWSGVVSDFILPRWKVFIDYSNETLVQNKPFNDSYIKQRMFKTVEEPFTFQKTMNFSEPKGDLVEIMAKLQNTWWDFLENFDKNEEDILNIINTVKGDSYVDQIKVNMFRKTAKITPHEHRYQQVLEKNLQVQMTRQY